MSNLSELKSKTADLEYQLAEAQARLRETVDYGASLANRVGAYFTPRLEQSERDLLAHLAGRPRVSRLSWKDPAWLKWVVEEVKLPDLAYLRYGDQIEVRPPGKLTVPAFAPFVGRNRTIIIQSPNGAAKQGEILLQSLLVRTALLLPHQASFTLLDPAGNGAAFPMRRFLPQVRQNGDDTRRDLDAVSSEIRRIVETYLDAAIVSFEQVPDEMRVNERYHLVFAADFPHGYDRRAIEALHRIGDTGPKAGVYVFIHHNQDYELPRDMSMSEFRNAFYIPAAETTQQYRGHALRVVPDEAPPAPVQESVFAALSKAAPVERRIDWDDAAGFPREQWWTRSSSTLIETPIGKRGAGSDLRFWFGENKDGRPCVHGILGAMPGAGKSSFFHALLAGLSTRYGPDELRMYLIDGKNGVEFQPYTRLPHAEVVSLLTAPELARSVLRELIEEMQRRNALFGEKGVRQISEFRKFGDMPRILLVVDEYQMLFEDDKDGAGSADLRLLSEQGRNVGIHILLASQRFGAAGMLGQTAIFGNIHLRMAMKMTEGDVRALTEFQAKGKALISATCDLPGKIVVNDQAGDDTANLAGKVAWLSLERRNTLLKELVDKAALAPRDSLPRTVVFNGNAQPAIVDNPQARALLDLPAWFTPKELSDHARKPADQGGLGIDDWFAAQRPILTWLGQEFNVRGHAKVVFRRRPAENLVIVGSDNAVRYGAVAAALTGIATAHAPSSVHFAILDRSIEDSEWGNALADVVSRVLVPAGFEVEYHRDEARIDETLQYCVQEIERRRRLSESARGAEPDLIIAMTELDTVDAYRRRSDGFGLTDSASGELLRRVCSDGPAFGIHLILSFDSMSTLTSVLDDKRGMSQFKHRVAFQMSEDDSFRFCRKRDASRLQPDGPLPVCALYIDAEKDRLLRFKPYSIKTMPGTALFVDQLNKIGDALANRRR